MNHWIVASKPPDDKGREVLAVDARGTMNVARYVGRWETFDEVGEEWVPLKHATHWMELPEPPRKTRETCEHGMPIGCCRICDHSRKMAQEPQGA